MSSDSTGLNLQDSLERMDSVYLTDSLVHARSGVKFDTTMQPKPDISADTSLIISEQGSNFEANPIERNSYDWITGLLIVCFIIYAWIRFKYKRRIYQIFQAFLAKNYANQFAREGNLFKEIIFIPLIAFASISISIFYFQCNNYFHINFLNELPGVLSFLFILAIILSFWFAKITLIKLLEIIFETKSTTYEYLLSMHIHFILNGLILLPILILTTYITNEVFLTAGIFLSAAIYLMWIYRAFSIGLKEKAFSVSYLFLYLCTFEILPVFVLAKLLINNN